MPFQARNNDDEHQSIRVGNREVRFFRRARLERHGAKQRACLLQSADCQGPLVPSRASRPSAIGNQLIKEALPGILRETLNQYNNLRAVWSSSYAIYQKRCQTFHNRRGIVAATTARIDQFQPTSSSYD